LLLAAMIVTVESVKPDAFSGGDVSRLPYRRCFCALCALGVAWVLLASWGGAGGEPDLVWGTKGVIDGYLSRPRAIAIDREDRLFLVDFSPRIQVFDLDGNYLGPTWKTPDFRNGRPSGLDIDRHGDLIVSDSHYHCIRIYKADGTELRKVGGEAGSGPGQFGYISDCVQDSDGYFFVSEFGSNERITKLNEDGTFVMMWGRPGAEPGAFNRPRALALGADGNLYVADACNHRVQVFTRDGELVRVWGNPGSAPGELSYPYDLAFSPTGELYVAEWGNHRVQKFSPDGVSKGTWGSPGGRPGQLSHPWALAVDRHGRVHVVDTENHRVQRIEF
jgi:sugar lactone lactonase YvrE